MIPARFREWKGERVGYAWEDCFLVSLSQSSGKVIIAVQYDDPEGGLSLKSVDMMDVRIKRTRIPLLEGDSSGDQ